MTSRLRAYLVDDEPLALKRLTRLLEATGRVRIAGSATDPEAALAYLAAHDVDVLFLDIQMPGMTGFELLARLPAPPPVVFTTAYDRYAVKAFEVNSLDYLLKPVEKPRLAATLDKLERLRGGPARPDLRAVVAEVAAALRTGPAFPDRIASRSGERVQLVELAHVTHFFARDKLTFAASAGKDYVVERHHRRAGGPARPPDLRPHPPRHPPQPRLGPGGPRLVRRPPDGAAQGRQAHRARSGPRPGPRLQGAPGAVARAHATWRTSVAAYRVSGATSAPFGQQTVEPDTKNSRK